MVAFDSDERLKRAVDATIQAMEGATGTSQQADQPSVTPASAQARTLLPVMERHLRIRCARQTSLRRQPSDLDCAFAGCLAYRGKRTTGQALG